MTDEAHRELDRAVCRHVFGVDPNTITAKPLDMFSSDMTAAWKVHNKACTWPFGKRKLYYAHIRILASEMAGIRDAVVDYPDVLTLAATNMPEVICRAALAVVLPVVEPTYKKKSNEVRGMLGREI